MVAEPVLSAGGVIVPPPGYFARLVELAHERGMLVLLDECQTGLGRLGAMYGFQVYGVVPDLLVLSKTLGGGVPISALITSAAIEQECVARKAPVPGDEDRLRTAHVEADVGVPAGLHAP